MLGIAWDRPDFVDDDATGFGWGIVPRLMLTGDDGAGVMLEAALVLALHNAPEPEGAVLADGRSLEQHGFDLEFAVDGERLHVPLERFLAAWLGRLPRAVEVVLALCNPAARAVARPVGLAAGSRLWWAQGNVDSWAEDDGGKVTWGLSAGRWKVA